ncbi:right-handed parallel beta-helix repeat-containing protein [Lewinella sp. 4G2]|uniref:right-handed parallel beta-helix repeat-containing protein n=1 Tax=Lewinella sp. 4G2 TaxID=1803372 RepID=UPI0007B45CB0|nr:right-handed parallel beta-helix repeat-containing protein [Lewinella sp. 4G2]OAV42824.1 hypothetical protein A3850_016465 [Lewinella sp. 4G2]
MFRLPYLLVLLLAALPGTCVSAQTTYFVATDGVDDDTRDGLSTATAWASLAYACERVPGDINAPDTIQIGAGTFIVTEAATPEPGVAIQGEGADQTILRSGPDWVMTNRPKDEAWQDYIISFEKFPLGYNGIQTTNMTVRNLRLESTLDNLTHGGIYFRDVDSILIENLEIVDFGWAGIAIQFGEQIEVRGCYIENANRTEDDFFSGNIHTAWLRDAKFHDIIYRNTVPGDRQWGVGYKGGGHTNVQIYDSDFSTGSGFDIEIPFEQEFGVDIYNNTFNRTVSVPKGGANGDPASRGFTYSMRIRDNYFTNGYDIEGPREYMEVCHNFFDVQNDNGRCYAQFGSTNIIGRNSIHHNVAVGVDRSFFWVNGGLDTVDFYNNTLYYENADNRAGAMIAVRSTVTGWNIKNNLLVSPADQPRLVGAVMNGPSTEFEANLAVNALDASLPAGNYLDEDPGLNESGAMPDTFFAPASATSFVVDRGVDVGFPFEGAAPDIGAYEYVAAALPIELLAFSGQTEKEAARLQWSVANASNFSHFEVLELTTEGTLALAQVPYNGDRDRYELLVDWTTGPTERTFQLKMVDLDGSEAMSDALTLRRVADTEDVVVFPNPTTELLNFRMAERGAYRLYAADGQLFGRGMAVAPLTSVPVSHLASGTYRLVVIGRRGDIRTVAFVR